MLARFTDRHIIHKMSLRCCETNRLTVQAQIGGRRWLSYCGVCVLCTVPVLFLFVTVLTVWLDKNVTRTLCRFFWLLHHTTFSLFPRLLLEHRKAAFRVHVISTGLRSGIQYCLRQVFILHRVGQVSGQHHTVSKVYPQCYNESVRKHPLLCMRQKKTHLKSIN